jgi:hypothetical protein
MSSDCLEMSLEEFKVDSDTPSDKQCKEFRKRSFKAEDDAKVANILCNILTLVAWSHVLFDIVIEYSRTIHICYIFGGTGGIGEISEIDQPNKSISEKVSLTEERQSNCGYLIDGIWSDLPLPMPVSISRHTSLWLGEYIYVTGGYTRENYVIETTMVSRLHISTSIWSIVSVLPEPRADHGCVGFDGNLYCIGGLSNVTICNSMFRYETKNDIWTIMSSMKHHRIQSSYVVFKNRIYTFGGRNTSTCEFYRISDNTWYDVMQLSTIRFDCRVVVIENSILLMGGFIGNYNSGCTDLVEEYSHDLNRWRRMNWKLPVHSTCFVPWYDEINKLLYIAVGYLIEDRDCMNLNCGCKTGKGNVYARRMTNDIDDVTSDWMIVSDRPHYSCFGLDYSSAVVTC